MPADTSASEAAVGRGHRWRGAVLVALFALAFLLGCFPMADFDIWWHLRTGQFILEHSAVPRFDIFTYTNAGRPWIDIYWLFQVVVALLYRAGGVSALVLLKAIVGVAIVALALAARRPGAATGPAVLAWLPALIVLSGRLCERPELFIDPRLEVNSAETFERYLAGLRGLWRGVGWEAPLGIDPARPDEIPALLVERGILSHVIDVLAHDPHWHCVHADAVAAVFVATPFAEAHQLAEVTP